MNTIIIQFIRPFQSSRHLTDILLLWLNPIAAQISSLTFNILFLADRNCLIRRSNLIERIPNSIPFPTRFDYFGSLYERACIVCRVEGKIDALIVGEAQNFFDDVFVRVIDHDVHATVQAQLQSVGFRCAGNDSETLMFCKLNGNVADSSAPPSNVNALATPFREIVLDVQWNPGGGENDREGTCFQTGQMTTRDYMFDIDKDVFSERTTYDICEPENLVTDLEFRDTSSYTNHQPRNIPSNRNR